MWRRRLEIEWTVNFQKNKLVASTNKRSAVAEMGNHARAKWAESKVGQEVFATIYQHYRQTQVRQDKGPIA